MTGAGSGIGRSTALALQQRGAAVAVLDIDEEAAAVTAKEIVEAGGRARAWMVDVTDRERLTEVSDQIADELGPATIVVNNAGVGMSGRFADFELEDWDWIRSVNLDGVVNGCNILARPLLERGDGHVVNMSSGLGYVMRATEVHYVTTKAAVLALSRCLRADWRSRGVGVSAVCPGVIDTAIYERSRLAGDRADERVQKRTAKLFARGHHPDKVAEAVCRAIEKDLGVVPVGWEARLGWIIDGNVPQRVERRLAGMDIL